MKINSLIVPAVESSSQLFRWLTRATLALGLILLPFAIDTGLNFDSGSVAYGAQSEGGGGGNADKAGAGNGGGQGKSGKPAGNGDEHDEPVASSDEPDSHGGGGGKHDEPVASSVEPDSHGSGGGNHDEPVASSDEPDTPSSGGGKPDEPSGKNGGGQGNPDEPGGGDGKPEIPGRGQGDLYSELVVKYRSGQGLQIFVGVPAGESDEKAEASLAEGHVACQQPLTLEVDDPGIATYANSTNPPLTNPLINPANGKQMSPVPLGGTGAAGEECDVDVDYVLYPVEVHFGRLNIGRSPDNILIQQLHDVTGVLDTNALELGWDAAGRITAGDFTVDSPLQNLAIHKELLVFGSLESQSHNPIPLPSLYWYTGGKDYLHYATAALGAAADKGYFDIAGLINLDLVVYNNRILDIPNLTVLGTVAGNGTVGVLDELYYDFSDFTYNRAAKYPGCFEAITIGGDPVSGTIMDIVFKGRNFVQNDVFAFATAADDSRRMIAFTHATEELIVTAVDIAGDDSICPIE